MHRVLTRIAALLAALCLALALPAAEFDFQASTYLGGASSSESVRGIAMQSNGTIVAIANIPDYTPPGATPIALGAGSASSQGMVIRFAPDGRSVLSVTRLGQQLLDVCVDDDDNIYIAAWEEGFYKLDPTAQSVVWHQDIANVRRVDVTGDGISAAVVTNEVDPDSETPMSNIHLFDNDEFGSSLSRITGHRSTLDVAIDGASQTVCFLGWRQASAFDGKSTKPVQISYVRGTSYTGEEKWTAYDWSTDRNADDFLNRSNNNMADSRGICCDIGRDGKLYVAYEVAGGNHMFRYDPFDITKTVSIVKGDMWHDWYDTKSEHKTFFARHEPATGAYLTGQQFCARLNSGSGNTLRPKNITADKDGNVYLVGDSAAHLPIPDRYTPKAGEVAVNPVPFENIEDYEGGAFLLVMSPDLVTRRFCTRTTLGVTYGIDARILEDGQPARIAWGGQADIQGTNIHYTTNAIQSSQGGGDKDAFLTVIAPDLTAAQTPLISPSGGDHLGSVQVTLASAPASAAIYYTTDGSTPDEGSTRYDSAFLLNTIGTTTLKARAFADGLSASDVAESTFTITADTTAPQLLGAAATGDTSITLTFDEVLDAGSAQTAANYALDNGIAVSAATLSPDGRTVNLTTTPMLSGTTYVVSVNNVTDAASDPNPIASDTTASFTYVAYTIEINFQPAGSDVPAGYLVDSGAAFGDRGNGYDYGWNADNTDSARDRGGISDQRLATFNHLQRNGDFTWEIALDDGLYYLHLAAYDPDFTETHAIAAEGEIVLDGDTAIDGPLQAKDVLVTVEDGRLTLSSPQEETFNKINFIRIARAGALTNVTRRVSVSVSRDGANVAVDADTDNSEATVNLGTDQDVFSDYQNWRPLRVFFNLGVSN